MTKSTIDLEKTSLRFDKDSPDTCSSIYSRHDYIQHQLFDILTFRQFRKTDYRGIIQMLQDFSDLRKVLQLKKVPHYSTLCYAEKRLLTGTPSKMGLHKKIKVLTKKGKIT